MNVTNLLIIVLSLLYMIFISSVSFLILDNLNQPNPNHYKTKLAEKSSEFLNVTILDGQISSDSAKIKGSLKAYLPTKNGWDLAKRHTLEENEALISISEVPHEHYFKMANNYSPIDIIWVNGMSIVDFDENLQPAFPNQPAESLPRYAAKDLIDKFVVVNAGFMKAHNIKIGDQIKLGR